MTTERWIVVLGAGGTGLYMAEVIERTDGCRCGGFLDDDPSKRPEDCCGYPVLGRLGDWASLPEEYAFVTSLYGPKSNPRLAQVVESLQIPDGRWASVVEGQAWVSRHASIGIGCFVGPGSVIEPMATLGPRCALLGNVYIAHHVRLAEYVVCANSASVAGGVSIGRATYIGANATIREYLAVGGGHSSEWARSSALTCPTDISSSETLLAPSGPTLTPARQCSISFPCGKIQSNAAHREQFAAGFSSIGCHCRAA